MKADRKYEVVLFGATGFVGRLTAQYLASRYGAELRWALAGRDARKLELLRTELGPASPDVLVADARDRASLDAITGAAKVVVTTVGPYALYGRELVASCAEHGTDYCDLTGEVTFMAETVRLHHERATQSGARIVHACGFDSIPSDLGTLLVQTAARGRHGVPCREVKFLLKKARGGFSGGTFASMFTLVEQASKDRSLRRMLADPYSLNPPGSDRGPDGRDQTGARYDAQAGTWTAPFMMSLSNTRVVRRSNALLGYPYGKDFQYSEAMATGRGPGGAIQATAVAAGTGALFSAAAWAPTRWLLTRMLPKPGEGPSEKAREQGEFWVRFLGLGDRFKLEAWVGGKGDPGYNQTAKMLGESAVCLAREVPGVKGGVLTPASCLGEKLLTRLRAAGMTFEVEEAATVR
jgi:short subunit dehydrogenase-like uncharacterized protein